MTTLKNMLGKLDDKPAASTKTANARRPSTSSVDAEIVKAMDAIGSEKTASAKGGEQEVVPGLMKIAQELTQAEKTASAAEAVEHGRLMARGFIDEMAQYTKAAADLNQGQQTQRTDADEMAILSKFANENPDAYREVYARGYSDKMTPSEKQAHEKNAAEQALVEKYASEDPQGFEADVEQGYKTAADQLYKQASAEFNQGFVETVFEHRKLAANNFAMGFDAMNLAIDQHIKSQGQRRA